MTRTTVMSRHLCENLIRYGLMIAFLTSISYGTYATPMLSTTSLKVHSFILPYRAKLCRAKLFVGRNVRHQTKNSSLSPGETFCQIKVKLFLVEVQVNLRGYQVIETNYDFLVGRNFVGRNFRHF